MKRLILSFAICMVIGIIFVGCDASNKFIGTIECKGFFPGVNMVYVINSNHKYKLTIMGVEQRGFWDEEDDNAIKLTNDTDYQSVILEYKNDKYILGQFLTCKKLQ